MCDQTAEIIHRVALGIGTDGSAGGLPPWLQSPHSQRIHTGYGVGFGIAGRHAGVPTATPDARDLKANIR